MNTAVSEGDYCITGEQNEDCLQCLKYLACKHNPEHLGRTRNQMLDQKRISFCRKR